MAITYIKLGPIGDAFASNELGLYLNPGSATQVDDILLKTRLKNFFKTGFLVEISKLEYDNIVIRNYNARNIPLISVSVTESVILEPVENVLRIPPTDVTIGRRYLVYTDAAGPWLGKDDYIAYFNGSFWEFKKPIDGMILPVYAWGVSLHYTGTYPSGKWDYSEEQNPELSDISEPPLTYEQYAYDLFAKERAERIQADLDLLEQIKNIKNPALGEIRATQVLIDDVQNYFEATNVELALFELARKLQNQGVSIYNINDQIIQILQKIQTLTDNQFPSIKYEGNIDKPTTETVGGVEKGTIIPEIELTDLISNFLNPYRYPDPSIKLEVLFDVEVEGNTYYIPKGDSAIRNIYWDLGGRTLGVIAATLSNVTNINPPLPILADNTKEYTLSGSATYTSNNNDGIITLSETLEDNSVENEVINIAYKSPILFGYADLADLGLSGTDLWNLLTQRIWSKKPFIELPINFADKYLIIAVPNRYESISGILDDGDLNNIRAFSQRTDGITTTGLGNNFSEQYKIYEAKYIGSSIGTWKLRK